MAEHFAQLSDPHLTSLESVQARDLINKRALGYLSWRRRRRHEHSPQVLAALQDDLASYAPGNQPLAQLLVTGDLTHIGLPDEFQQARAWLEGLGKPTDIALVPGNHDACVSAPWDSTFALWRPYMAADGDSGAAADPIEFPTLRVRGGIAFLGVSTGVPKAPLMATGTAGTAQIKRLRELLIATKKRGLFRVVYLHHCPARGREKWRKRLTDAALFQDMLEVNGAELVVHGHGHRRHYTQLSTRDGATPVIAVPSASALALHGADMAQYNVFSVQRVDKGWKLDVNARVYEPASGAFLPDESCSIELLRQHAGD